MTALDTLQHRCRDVSTLKPALHRLCESFGGVARLHVLTAMHYGEKQAICFLRLVSPEKEEELIQTLGVGRFGGEIVFVVELGTAGSEAQELPFEWRGHAAQEDCLQPQAVEGQRDALVLRPPQGKS
ncbi:MAG: hypothetical protein JWP96_684 [Polaromonas sp.]|nr:hypothetical protein [Polaromonas sp.]